MIQLFAYSQSDDSKFYTELDAIEADIELMFQVEDLSDITARRAPHSLNFDLPMTETNDAFFGHYYNANVQVGTWSPFEKTRVEVRDQGIRLFNGTLQLINVDTYNRLYSVAIVSSVADLFSAVKGATWADVLGTSLDHALSAANIIDSFDTTNDITSGLVGAGTVVYPLADYGNRQDVNFAFFFMGGVYSGYGINGAPGIEPQKLRPAVKVRYLFEAICTYAGFSITSNFFSTDEFDKLYMAVGTHLNALPMRNAQAAYVGLNPGITASPNVITAIAFNVESGDYYDVDNVFSGGVFTAFATGVFQFQMSISLLQAAFTGVYNAQILAVSNDNTWTYQTSGNYQVQNVVNWTWNLSLSQGETVTFYILHNGANALTVQSGSSVMMTAYDIGGAGALVNLPASLLDVTVDKWLKEIVFRYNLSFIELDYEHELQVEPYMNLLALGTTKRDWTNKIDTAKKVVIKPPTEHQKRRRVFQDLAGKDKRNRITQESVFSTNGNRPYGTATVVNNNQFSYEEEEYESIFTPLRLRMVDGMNYDYSSPSNVLVPIHYDETMVDGVVQRQSVYQNPWLGYYNGVRDVDPNDPTYSIYIDGTATTEYPLFTGYSAVPITSNSYSVYWSVVPPDHSNVSLIGNTPAPNSIFKTYHQPYLQAIEDVNARIMECSALLSPAEVNSLRWNDQIWIKDGYWRVVKMSNYSVGDTKPVQLTLLKNIIGSQLNCALNLVSFNVNGTTNWEDETGTSATPTKLCCEAAGLQWDPSRNACVWFTGTDGHGDGGPVSPDGVDPFPDDTDPTGEVVVKANFANLAINAQTIPALVETDGSGWFNLQNVTGGTQWVLKSNNIYNVSVKVTGIEKTATGTFGNKAIAEFAFAFDYTTATPRAVGTVQTVASTGDWTIGFQPLATGTNNATLALQVAGVATKDITYAAVVTFITTNVASKYVPVFAGDALWQNGDTILWQDGNEMLWNG